MKKSINEQKAIIFKALSNPVRLDIIDQLLDGEKCVCELQTALKKYEQPHISKSLAKLKAVGLLQDRREGNNIFYALRIGGMGRFFACLNEIISGRSPEEACK